MTSQNTWNPERAEMIALPRLVKHTTVTSYAPARVEMGEEA